MEDVIQLENINEGQRSAPEANVALIDTKSNRNKHSSTCYFSSGSDIAQAGFSVFTQQPLVLSEKLIMCANPKRSPICKETRKSFSWP